jgi:nucleoid DNA-binding protein
MIRSELVDVVYRSHGGLSRADAQGLLDLILDLIKSKLAAGEKVDIPGFGSFEIVRSMPREGRHPVTGRRFRVPGGRSLVFRPSRRLEEQLNESADAPGTASPDAAGGAA